MSGDEGGSPARRIDSWLEERALAGEIPGAAWAVSGTGGVLAEGAAGRAALVPESSPADCDTIYDLASLTKPLVTSLLLLGFGFRRLGLDPEDPVRRFLPEIDRNDKKDIRLGHLLTHTSGLPGWMPLYAHGTTIAEYLSRIAEAPPQGRPGERVIYSDLGYMLLGEILARCATSPLDRLAGSILFEPLGLDSTCFTPSPALRGRVAPTEDSCHYERKLSAEKGVKFSGFRDGIIRGEVHDQNAWSLGGVAGHAGLFSTARETAALAMEYLGAGRGLLDDEALRWATSDMTVGLDEARSFAFRLALRGETPAGPSMPPEAFGHNGFTGTSAWFDPRRKRAFVLLTNRVHPEVVEGFDMMPLRREFHSLARSI